MIFDLTHSVTDKMLTYPGDPIVSIASTASEDNLYNVSAIMMGTHSGTHVDLPLHCIKGGEGAGTAALNRFFGDAVVIRVPFSQTQPIDLSKVDLSMVKSGDILLIASGWDEFFGQAEFFTRNVGFADGTGELLKILEIKALGTDLPSVDVPGNGAVNHLSLLSNGIIIFEALKGLCMLEGKRVTFYGVPLKIISGDGSPIRAFATD